MLARHVLLPFALLATLANLILLVIALTAGFHFPMYVAGSILLILAAISGALACTWWEHRAPFNLNVIIDRSPVRLSDDTE